jgi:hypothetical protein
MKRLVPFLLLCTVASVGHTYILDKPANIQPVPPMTDAGLEKDLANNVNKVAAPIAPVMDARTDAQKNVKLFRANDKGGAAISQATSSKAAAISPGNDAKSNASNANQVLLAAEAARNGASSRPSVLTQALMAAFLGTAFFVILKRYTDKLPSGLKRAR